LTRPKSDHERTPLQAFSVAIHSNDRLGKGQEIRSVTATASLNGFLPATVRHVFVLFGAAAEVVQGQRAVGVGKIVRISKAHSSISSAAGMVPKKLTSETEPTNPAPRATSAQKIMLSRPASPRPTATGRGRHTRTPAFVAHTGAQNK